MTDSQIFDQVQTLLENVTTEEAIQHIERLQAEIQEKEAEQAKWRALVGLKQQLGEAIPSTDGRRLTLPDSVLLVLREQPAGTSMRLRDIGRELQRRGWLPDDKNAYHRLQMAASKMQRRGDLERPEHGYYKLPPTVTAGGGGEGK
jgi:hypothetical protein